MNMPKNALCKISRSFYCRYTALLFIIFLGLEDISAQQQFQFLKYTAKTNPLQILCNEPNVSLEYRFHKLFGIEAGYSKYGLYKIYTMEPLLIPQFVPYQGYTYFARTKIYIFTENRLEGPALFIAPGIFRKEKYLRDYRTDRVTGTRNYFTWYEDNKGFNLVGGVQNRIDKNLLAEIYVGIGVKTQKMIPNRFYNLPMYQPTIHLGFRIGCGFGNQD